MLGENVGLFVVTSLALALWISIATGLRFWSRRGAGGLARRYHRWATVVMLPFLAIVLITTTWYWGENIAGYFDIRPSGDIPRIGAADVARVRRHDATLPIDRLVSNARSVYPELEVHLVSLPTAGRPIFSVAGHADESGLVRELANQVFVHPFNGDVIEVRRARDLDRVAWWEHVVDAIHFGTWGGAWTRALWMCCGIACAMLTIAGWIVRRRRLAEASTTAASRR
jgi:uncharacterized iron-regulated membrane protein